MSALLTLREAHAVLQRDLGSHASTWETFKSWTRPGRQAEGRAPELFPAAIRVPGAKRRAIRRRDLDRWIEHVRQATE